jgi:hypothetical protein
VREQVLNTVHVTHSLLVVIRDEAPSTLSHAEYAGNEPAGPYPRSPVQCLENKVHARLRAPSLQDDTLPLLRSCWFASSQIFAHSHYESSLDRTRLLFLKSSESKLYESIQSFPALFKFRALFGSMQFRVYALLRNIQVAPPLHPIDYHPEGRQRC